MLRKLICFSNTDSPASKKFISQQDYSCQTKITMQTGQTPLYQQTTKTRAPCLGRAAPNPSGAEGKEAELHPGCESLLVHKINLAGSLWVRKWPNATKTPSSTSQCLPNWHRVHWWVLQQWRLLQHTCAFLRVTFPYCCAERAVRMTQLSTPFLLSHKYSLFKTSPTYTFILTILVLAVTCLHCTPEEMLTINYQQLVQGWALIQAFHNFFPLEEHCTALLTWALTQEQVLASWQ